MDTQKRDSISWLEGLEDGKMGSNDLYTLAQKLDPVLTSLMIRYLRKKYPSTKPEAAGVISRLVELSGTYPQVVKNAKDAEADPICEWFLETYSFSEFYSKPEEMIDLIVEKLEG
jgi:hypothetical protein